MHYFYTPDINGSLYSLSPEESKHAIKVLRLRLREEVGLLDGKGTFYLARVIENQKNCQVEIIETKSEFGKRNCHVHIAIAPTKNIDRFEWFVEKTVEVGIDMITPLITEHSERRVLKLDRIEKVAIAAMKQSVKSKIPAIAPLTKFTDFIKQPMLGARCIAYCGGENRILLKDIASKNSTVTVIIGPEGDFSQAEVESALKQKFQLISLGNSRLRTETAGIVACHIVNLMNENNENEIFNNPV